MDDGMLTTLVTKASVPNMVFQIPQQKEVREFCIPTFVHEPTAYSSKGTRGCQISGSCSVVRILNNKKKAK
jgi:hypothetical protein